MKQLAQQSRRHEGGGSSRLSYAAGPCARPAPLVRGSSRRITTMRRHQPTLEYQSDQPSNRLPRLLRRLLDPDGEVNSRLEGSFHIRSLSP